MRGPEGGETVRAVLNIIGIPGFPEVGSRSAVVLLEPGSTINDPQTMPPRDSISDLIQVSVERVDIGIVNTVGLILDFFSDGAGDFPFVDNLPKQIPETGGPQDVSRMFPGFTLPAGFTVLVTSETSEIPQPPTLLLLASGLLALSTVARGWKRCKQWQANEICGFLFTRIPGFSCCSCFRIGAN
jgi:hypothetical protein